MKPKPRCQCTPTCKKPPLNGSPFCEDHVKRCDRVAPLSGSESPYQPEKYNKYKGIRESHNCYAYATGFYNLPREKGCTKESCPISYPQPGLAGGYPKWSKVDGKRCPDLIARIMGDIPQMKPSTFTKRCPRGMRKIVPVVAPKDDYHFFMQDKDGQWSHKPGATEVTRLDSEKRPIYDPQLASRSGGINYTDFCGYWCIPAEEQPHLKRGGKRTMRKRRRGRGSSRGRRHR